MNVTKTIPASAVAGLELHTGDALHVLAVTEESILVQLQRMDSPQPAPRGKASEWLKTARGAVRLLPGESADDIRMDYYADKYGLPQ